MSAKKILLLTLAIIVALICLGFLGVRTFTQNVVNNRDCEWANIDHIEMRAMVDIPAVSFADCNYDAEARRKTTVFTLDKNQFYIVAYASEQDFQKIPNLPETFDFDREGLAKADVSTLYLREGKTETNDFRMLLDAKNGKLWVDLHYFNAD